MAARLAETGNFTVAVIEAGGFYEQENGNLTLVPGYYQDNIAGPGINWNFTTAAEPQLTNMTGNYARGKTLGGSSALNAMIYHRGTIGSYQLWADEVGDQSYTFDNLLPFFEKGVNFTQANAQLRAANATVPPPTPNVYSANDGPLHVSYSNMAAPISSWGQLGLREIGIPDIEDFSSGKLIGGQYIPLTVRPDDQTRSSSESSYLQHAFAMNQMYPTLKVYIHSLATKVVFDSNKTATGVEVKTGEQTYLLSATKEVILSAGAFQSPQLLMVSGVGPSQQLAEHNISVIADRPGVGQNMWDHILFPVTYEVNVITESIFERPGASEAASLEYLQNQTGLLTTQSADYLGWEKIPQNYHANLSAQAKADLATFPADWPDFELIVIGFRAFGAGPQVGKMYADIETALISPLSRGSVEINSSSMEDQPLINLGWLTNETDVETTVIALKRGRDYWNSLSMREVRIGEEVNPGANVTTDEEIRQYVREHATTVYHASCTCKMGKVDDPMAVTDSRARVIGVNNLRVVDASTFPVLPPGHPQGTVNKS